MVAFQFEAIVYGKLKNVIKIESDIKVSKLIALMLESYGLKARKGSYLLLMSKMGKNWDESSKLDKSLLDVPIQDLKLRKGKKLFLKLSKNSDIGIEIKYNGKTEPLKGKNKNETTTCELTPEQIEELTGTEISKNAKQNTKNKTNSEQKTDAKSTKKANKIKNSSTNPTKDKTTKTKLNNNELDSSPEDSESTKFIEKLISNRLRSDDIAKPQIDEKHDSDDDYDLYDDSDDYHDEDDEEYDYENNLIKNELPTQNFIDEDDDTDDIFDDDDFADDDDFTDDDDFADDDDYFDNRDDFSDFYYDDEDGDEKYY